MDIDSVNLGSISYGNVYKDIVSQGTDCSMVCST